MDMLENPRDKRTSTITTISRMTTTTDSALVVARYVGRATTQIFYFILIKYLNEIVIYLFIKLFRSARSGLVNVSNLKSNT